MILAEKIMEERKKKKKKKRKKSKSSVKVMNYSSNLEKDKS